MQQDTARPSDPTPATGQDGKLEACLVAVAELRAALRSSGTLAAADHALGLRP